MAVERSFEVSYSYLAALKSVYSSESYCAGKVCRKRNFVGLKVSERWVV
jgi:hypothetical protein